MNIRKGLSFKRKFYSPLFNFNKGIIFSFNYVSSRAPLAQRIQCESYAQERPTPLTPHSLNAVFTAFIKGIGPQK